MTRFSFPFFFWRPGEVLLSGNMPDVCAATRKVKSLHGRHDPPRRLRRNHPQVRQTAAAVTWRPQIHSRRRQLKHREEGADTEGAGPEAEPAGLSPCHHHLGTSPRRLPRDECETSQAAMREKRSSCENDYGAKHSGEPPVKSITLSPSVNGTWTLLGGALPPSPTGAGCGALRWPRGAQDPDEARPRSRRVSSPAELSPCWACQVRAAGSLTQRPHRPAAQE